MTCEGPALSVVARYRSGAWALMYALGLHGKEGHDRDYMLIPELKQAAGPFADHSFEVKLKLPIAPRFVLFLAFGVAQTRRSVD